MKRPRRTHKYGGLDSARFLFGRSRRNFPAQLTFRLNTAGKVLPLLMAKVSEKNTLPAHGASILPSVEIDSYNLEIEDDEGFVGDKASKGAFREILDGLRKSMREFGQDPLGGIDTEDISKKQLDAVLAKGSPEAAGVVQGAIEEFAQQLANVIRRFLKAKAWHDTECIVVGGGFRARRVGELAIGRCGVILKGEGVPVDIELIRHNPDEAGLIGAAHLLPAWMLAGHKGILAVDVGGTNIRAGLIELKQTRAKDLSEAIVLEAELWRHGDEDVKRDEAVERLVEMVAGLVKSAKKSGLSLAPVIGVGCPGIIDKDGSIERGARAVLQGGPPPRWAPAGGEYASRRPPWGGVDKTEGRTFRSEKYQSERIHRTGTSDLL